MMGVKISVQKQAENIVFEVRGEGKVLWQYKYAR